MRCKGKRGQSSPHPSLPSPPLLSVSSDHFLLTSTFDVTLRRPVRVLGRACFYSLAPPLPNVPHISHTTTLSRVYNVLPQSQQAEPEEADRGKVAVDFSASSDTLQPFLQFHISFFFFSPLCLSFSFFLFFQPTAENQRDKRSQSCSLAWGSGSCQHQNGLHYQPPNLREPAPDQLWAGSSVPGGWCCQSAWGALLAGASVAGHRGHGEVLVPLHLSLWNHLFGDRHSRDRCHLHLQWPASDQGGVRGAACHGSSAAAAGHRLLDCPQEKEEKKERGGTCLSEGMITNT